MAMLLLVGATAASAWAVGGPVILGGDDLQDHGGTDEFGNAEDGWVYIDEAVANIKPKVGRPNDGTIAAFGSEDPTIVVPGEGGDAGMAILHAAQTNGMGVRYFNDPSEINSGMASIAGGSYAPAMIWLAGTGSENDFDDGGGCDDGEPDTQSEGEAVTANADIINGFVNAGGGLMSHGTCYAWLASLLPGLSTVNSGSSNDLSLTPEGQAAFPGLTNDHVNAGPWHNYFEGNLGGLDVLVRSANRPAPTTEGGPFGGAAVVIGGGQVSLTEKPTDLSVGQKGTNKGNSLLYTITVTNNGPNPATGVTLVDDLPPGVTVLDIKTSQGSCSGTTQVTCSLGDIGVGGSVTIEITVRPKSTGNLTNLVRVSGNQPDPKGDNNSATDTRTFAVRSAARRDRTKPRVSIAGVSDSCIRTGFSARFRIREPRLRTVSVFLDGKRVLRTKRKVFRVRVNAARMRSGRHRLRAVAVDRAGNRRTVRRTFTRCARPAAVPHFTG